MEKKFSRPYFNQKMPNVKLVRAVFIYKNMFKFQDATCSSITSYVIVDTDRQTNRQVALYNHVATQFL